MAELSYAPTDRQTDRQTERQKLTQNTLIIDTELMEVSCLIINKINRIYKCKIKVKLSVYTSRRHI
jgi:hypothetical protein